MLCELDHVGDDMELLVNKTLTADPVYGIILLTVVGSPSSRTCRTLGWSGSTSITSNGTCQSVWVFSVYTGLTDVSVPVTITRSPTSNRCTCGFLYFLVTFARRRFNSTSLICSCMYVCVYVSCLLCCLISFLG